MHVPVLQASLSLQVHRSSQTTSHIHYPTPILRSIKMRFATTFTALFAAVAIAAPTPQDPISEALSNIPGPFGVIASGARDSTLGLIGGLIQLPQDIAGTLLGLPREIASDVWGNLTPFGRQVALEKWVDAQQKVEQK